MEYNILKTIILILFLHLNVRKIVINASNTNYFEEFSLTSNINY